jgi:hypothetical protein
VPGPARERLSQPCAEDMIQRRRIIRRLEIQHAARIDESSQCRHWQRARASKKPGTRSFDRTGEMGRYLCVFDADEELEGVEVGSYGDYSIFTDCVTRELEGGKDGSRFPTLILHSDCDGEWSPRQAAALLKELTRIRDEFRRRPAVLIPADWQMWVVEEQGLRLDCLYDCFFDVDGCPLLERMIGLARLSVQRRLPILFQ